MGLSIKSDNLLRSVYKRIIPLCLRQKAWKVYWAWCSITKDYLPVSPIFVDYEQYWSEVKNLAGAKFDQQISYHDLVSYCLEKIPTGSRVLDFGCGSGTLLRELQSRIQVIGVGIDISQMAVEVARSYQIDAHQLTLAGPDDLIPFGRFDVVTCTEVLEHTPQSELVLIALSRVSDRLLVSVPNTGYLYSRLRLLFGRFPRQWKIHPAEHLRYWTLRDFQQMVKQLGLGVESVIGVEGGHLGRIYPALFAPDLFFSLKVRHSKSV